MPCHTLVVRAVRALALIPLLCAPHRLGAQKPFHAACDNAGAGITLPVGFCAVVVADHVGSARQMVVAPNGDVFVAVLASRSGKGGVLALRDTTGDGRADVQVRFGPNGGNGLALVGDWLYFAPDDAVLRYRLPAGSLLPPGPPDTLVGGLPARYHTTKSIAVVPGGGPLYVTMGSSSNTCQQGRGAAAGADPCPELETRAGVWQYSSTTKNQREADGHRFATGLRNVVAFTLEPRTGEPYGLQHGRDELGSWTKYFDAAYNAENPGEIFVHLHKGDDYGWPYCYYETRSRKQLLAPEYGGDGRQAGRCASKQSPITAFPGHWAPDGLVFYTGTQFPPAYRNGVFIAFHGSWNRAPLPQAGYKVVFMPLHGDSAGQYVTFADGFAGANIDPASAVHRPVGLAQGPDGSLYVSDDQGGRIWRILYVGK